jgi:hypothetical protein
MQGQSPPISLTQRTNNLSLPNRPQPAPRSVSSRSGDIDNHGRLTRQRREDPIDLLVYLARERGTRLLLIGREQIRLEGGTFIDDPAGRVATSRVVRDGCP